LALYGHGFRAAVSESRDSAFSLTKFNATKPNMILMWAIANKADAGI
jgi:hypothetical protein